MHATVDCQSLTLVLMQILSQCFLFIREAEMNVLCEAHAIVKTVLLEKYFFPYSCHNKCLFLLKLRAKLRALPLSILGRCG